MVDEEYVPMDESLALVPYVAPTGQASKPAELPSPFEVFMDNLMSAAPPPHQVLTGSAEWGGPPILEIVMLGLWTVMTILGEKLADPLRTEAQAWTSLAPRVDRLVGIGMLLVYGTPEAAAEAFRTEVLGAVDRALANAPANTALLPQKVWGEASTKFFATLLKRCGEERKRFKGLSLRLSEANRFPNDRFLFSYVDISGVEWLNRMGQELMDYVYAGPGTLAEGLSTVPYAEVARLVEQYQKRFDEIRLMQRLPVSLRSLPEDTLDNEDAIRVAIPTVESDWLNTQMLLAALPNAPPELEYVDSEEGPRYRKHLDTHSVETLCDRFWERMEARRPGTSASRPALEAIVRGTARFCLEKFSGQFDRLAPFTAIIRFNADRSGLTRDNAYQVAAELDDAAYGMLFPKSDQERVGREELPSLVDWGTLDRDSFMEIIMADRIPLDAIAAQLPKMGEKVRESAVERILVDERLDQKTVAVLLDGGQVLLSFDTLPALVTHLTARWQKEGLRVFLDTLRQMSAELQEARWPTFRALAYELALVVSAKDQNEVYGAPEFRSAALDLLVHGFRIADGVGDKLWSRDRVLLRWWDKELLERFVLAAEVRYRDGIYEGKEESDLRFDSELREQCLPLWQDLADGWRRNEEAILWSDIPIALGITREEGRALLATHHEDEIFRWLYAADPDVDRRLRDFQERREVYYERKRQQKLFPMPPPKAPRVKTVAPKRSVLKKKPTARRSRR